MNRVDWLLLSWWGAALTYCVVFWIAFVRLAEWVAA